MNISKIKNLRKISNQSRVFSLMSIFFAGSGHGGVLSCIVIYLYAYKLKIKKFHNLRKLIEID